MGPDFSAGLYVAIFLSVGSSVPDRGDENEEGWWGGMAMRRDHDEEGGSGGIKEPPDKKTYI